MTDYLESVPSYTGGLHQWRRALIYSIRKMWRWISTVINHPSIGQWKSRQVRLFTLAGSWTAAGNPRSDHTKPTPSASTGISLHVFAFPFLSNSVLFLISSQITVSLETSVAVCICLYSPLYFITGTVYRKIYKAKGKCQEGNEIIVEHLYERNISGTSDCGWWRSNWEQMTCMICHYKSLVVR